MGLLTPELVKIIAGKAGLSLEVNDDQFSFSTKRKVDNIYEFHCTGIHDAMIFIEAWTMALGYRAELELLDMDVDDE